MAGLSIQQHRPWRVPALIGVILILAAMGAIYAHDKGWEMGTRGRGDAIAMRDQMAATVLRKDTDIDALKRENQQLREKLSRIEQNYQMEQRTVGECKDDLKSLQTDLIGKNESLAFYERIITPKDGRGGLRLDDIGLKKSTVKGVYHYKATLIQTLRHDRNTSGKVTMYVTGLQDGEVKRLSLADISLTDTVNHRYSFKYHQTFKGDIKIPEAFSPLRLELRIKPSGRGAAISQTFDWTEVAG